MCSRPVFQTLWLGGTLLLAVAFLAAAGAPGQTAKTEPTKIADAPQEARLRGKVVCLAEEMNKLYQASLPTNHEHVYGFRTMDGAYYTLLRTKYSEALFVDERVRDKELVLKGRVFPKSQIFEVFGMQSVHNGVLHDL